MNKKFIAYSCAAGALLHGHSAFAQQSAPPEAAAGASQGATAQPAGVLTEIVVTAQKRSENIQKAPLAISAATEDQMVRAGVDDFSNLQKIQPDITVNNVVGATNIAIRGVRQSALGPTNDTPTAVHLDGVYMARPTGLTGLFYDVQRIEVLKGPQGTLYGRNATGGVVNIITNKPSGVYEGQIEAEGGNYGLYRVEGALNAPVSDAVDLRGAFRVYHHDGYYSNGLDDADQKGGRLSAQFQFSPKAKLLISGDYEISDRKGSGNALLGETYTSAGQPPQAGIVVPSDPFKASSVLYPLGLGPTGEREEAYGAMAQFDYNLDFATFTAQYGYRRNTLAINSNTLGGTAAPPAAIGYSHSTADSATNSVEARLASVTTTPLQWVVGLYYFTEANSGDMCAPGSLTSTACGLDIGNPRNLTQSYAAFGQVTYTPPIADNRLHLALGLRTNDDLKKADTYTQLGPFLLTNLLDQHAEFKATTYKVGAAYDLTSTSMLYANMSTGYRAGGFAYGSTPLYKPETITAYEIGSKNRFLDNRLQVNVDGFHYNYKNVETNVIAPAPIGSPLPFSDLSVQSIGKVFYTGASLQIQYALTPSDRIEADVKYLSANYGNYRVPTKYIASPPLNAIGLPTGQAPGVYDDLQVLNTPPWTGTLSYDHSMHVARGTLDGRVSGQWSVERHLILDPTNSLQYQVGTYPGYVRADLSLRYSPDGGKWSVATYVHNVGDARTVTSAQYESARVSGLITGTLMEPRTYGMIVTARF